MKLRKYASAEERDQHWQSILDKNTDNFQPELSVKLSKKLGVKLSNDEVKASDMTLFNPERAKKIFDHIVK
jgi:hypothetical protein